MKRRPVVMYHSVDTLEDPMSLQVTPAQLRRQFRTLRRLGFRGVSMRELLAAPSSSPRLVGLTFDDGYADFATTAVPILEEFGFTATVFALAGQVGGTNDWDPPPRRPMMTAAQLREVHAAGYEVGSHGVEHLRLDTVSAEEQARQVAASKTQLEDLISAPVDGYCYPYGAVTEVSLATAREHYDYACAVDRRPPVDRWALPRFHVGTADGSLRLVAKLVLRPMRERLRDAA